MEKSQVVVSIVVSIITTLGTVFLTSSDLLDGMLNRDKVRLEIEKLRSDVEKYEEVSVANIEKVKAETVRALQDVKSQSDRLIPQIKNIEAETKLMQRDFDFKNLSNDLNIVRELRPLISVIFESKGLSSNRVLSGKLSIKNTGSQPFRAREFSQKLVCGDKEVNANQIDAYWSVAPGDSFKVNSVDVIVPSECKGCILDLSFWASSDPISMRLLEKRYPEILADFGDFFNFRITHNYSFSC